MKGFTAQVSAGSFYLRQYFEEWRFELEEFILNT